MSKSTIRVSRVITFFPNTRRPDLLVVAEDRGSWILINPTVAELIELEKDGFDRDYVQFPTEALDRFAEGGFQPIRERDIEISRSKGVITVAFWYGPHSRIVRNYGETSLNEAYDAQRIALGEARSLNDRARNREQRPGQAQPQRREAQDQPPRQERQPDQGKRDQRSPQGQPQQVRQNDQGRNNGQGQKQNPPPQGQGKKPDQRRETRVQPQPRHGQRQAIPVQQSASDAANGGNAELGKATLGDKFGSLKLPIVTAEAPADSETKVEEFERALNEVAEADPVVSTETNADGATVEEFGDELREAMRDGTTVEQALTGTPVAEPTLDLHAALTDGDPVAKPVVETVAATPALEAPVPPKPAKAPKAAKPKPVPTVSPAPKAEKKDEAKPGSKKNGKNRRLSTAEQELLDMQNIGK